MKSLYDISLKITEQEYRDLPLYSYSTLSKFNREGFNKLSSLYEHISTPSLTFGSLVDTLITGDDMEEKFYIMDTPIPTEKQKEMVDYLYDNFNNKYSALEDIPNEVIILVSEELKFQLGWKPETRARVLKENCGDYYKALFEANYRNIITPEIYDDALKCVYTLRTSTATKEYFNQDPFEDNIEKLYQLKFKGEFRGIGIKCMMDEVIVDHKNKVIIPCDLKTSYKPEWEFYKSFVEWNYFIQASCYSYILEQNLRKDEYFKDFKMSDYHFIVISNNTRQPLVWKYPLKAYFNTYSTEKRYGFRSWKKILLELDEYLKNEHKVPIGINTEGTNNILNYVYKKKN